MRRNLVDKLTVPSTNGVHVRDGHITDTSRYSPHAPAMVSSTGVRGMRGRPQAYGMELILDLHGCDLRIIASKHQIATFARRLCRLLKMRPYGQPRIPHFGHGNPHTSGYSLLQFIETSSITGHFSEAWGSAYINIFSCKPFNADRAARFTQTFFKATQVTRHRITRA